MISSEIAKDLVLESDSKILLLVIDGLGGLPHPKKGKTELEMANTPNLDKLASEGIGGMIDPIGRGITPGSGPSHLALFGYDPMKYKIGRGALSALGIGFELGFEDVAARINFATEKDGIITDRRAGRISTQENEKLCQKLGEIKIPGVEIFVKTVREHRGVVVFRGSGLSEKLTDSDPQKPGFSAKQIQPLSDEAKHTAEIANEFVRKAKEILSSSHPANMVLMRGFASRPALPSFSEVYKLKSAAVAEYPMYKGIALIVGMDILPTKSGLEGEFDTLKANFEKYDFFYLHLKATDSAGEDGDFEKKVRLIEKVDDFLPSVMELNPDVIAVSGDHSTPSLLKSHSWHSVPIIIRSNWSRPDSVGVFSESECIRGGLGRFPATEVMNVCLAESLRLEKFGA